MPPHPLSRLDSLKSALPLSHFLTDRFSRHHTYLRISITERCNLRCQYCMPEAGVPLSPPPHLLSTPEILELASLFVEAGVHKIRLTGGEPTVRPDVLGLMTELGRIPGLEELAMTSNAVALSDRKLAKMVAGGLTALNVSLDTLVPARFEFITRRKGLERVLACIDSAVREGVLVKVNCVVMRGVNEDEIVDFVEFTKERDVEVRFIEYMPFDVRLSPHLLPP